LLAIGAEVGDTAYVTILAQGDARNHAAIADLSAIRDGIRDVADQRALLGADLAALDAEPAIDAVRTVTVCPGVYCQRTAGNHGDAQPGATRHQSIRHTPERVRPIRIAVRIAPGEVGRAGNRHFSLQHL